VRCMLLPTTPDAELLPPTLLVDAPEFNRLSVVSSVKGEDVWLLKDEVDERLRDDFR